MKIKWQLFLIVVLAALLMGLVLPGCVSKAELEECQAQIADLEGQIADIEDRAENQTAQITDLEKEKSDLERQKAKLEEQKTDLEGQKAELEGQKVELEEQNADLRAMITYLREPPPEKVSGEIAGYISYEETVKVKRKFFPKGEVGGEIVGSSKVSRYPLNTLVTLEQFLADDITDWCPPSRPSSYNYCDHLAYRLKFHWVEAGLSIWSLHLAKVEIDTQYGKMLCWRNVFLTKENGEFTFYGVDPLTDKITKINEPGEADDSSEIYRVVIISNRL